MPKRTMKKKELIDAIDEPDKETEVQVNKKQIKSRNILSSGCNVLNLACTDNVKGAFLKGRYYLFVGASGSGKTWILLTTLAESLLHKKFKDYRIIYDNVEDGANMDMEFYFGKKTAEKLEFPEPKRTETIEGNKYPQPYSRTVEQFYDTIDTRLDEAEESGHGIIYILDSMDALTTEKELSEAKTNKKKRKEGKDVGGSYGDGKAKINSQNLRRICSRLDKSGSMLFIVAQERDNIGGMISGLKTFSGGNSMLFYATLQIWLKKYKEIKTTVKGVNHVIGNLAKVQIKKNRLTGQSHKEVLLPIYHSFGVDNIGSMVDWLVANGHWSGGKKTTSKIITKEFGSDFNKEKLVEHIEENELEDTLSEIVQQVWNDIKLQLSKKIKRKRRYE